MKLVTNRFERPPRVWKLEHVGKTGSQRRQERKADGLAVGQTAKIRSGTPISTVVPENSVGIEIIELVGVGFSTMFVMLLSFVRSFRVYFQSRADLQTEILALRHQIVVLQRGTPKPKLNQLIDASGSFYLDSGRDGIRRCGS